MTSRTESDKRELNAPGRTHEGNFAALIKRVWHVDPLRCPTCGAAMKIVSFIEPTQPDVIDAILTHCGLADKPAGLAPAIVRQRARLGALRAESTAFAPQNILAVFSR